MAASIESRSGTTANPFSIWRKSKLKKLGLEKDDAKWLRKVKNIGVQIFPCVPHTGFPDKHDLPELARFMRSMLEALNFAHSRGVMNGDIHKSNLSYDKKTGTT